MDSESWASQARRRSRRPEWSQERYAGDLFVGQLRGITAEDEVDGRDTMEIG